MTRLSEKRDVQDALVNYLIGIGWDYLPPDEALQARSGDLREPFLVPLAQEQLITLNASASLGAGPGLEALVEYIAYDLSGPSRP